MNDEQKNLMLFEYTALRANTAVVSHFMAVATAYANLPNPSNWRRLKRAMAYVQANAKKPDASLTPLLDNGFTDEG